MALSKIVKIADGMTNQYMVSFELGYIKQSDITCQVNEEVDGTGAPIYRSLVFLSPEIIQVGGAPQVSGDTVTFTRTVDRTQLIVNYEDGDVMNDENMNTAQKQAIMLIHELLDGRFERFDSGFDMGGNSITGLPIPTNPTDASNKQYVDDRVADNQQVAVDAAASASAASLSAGTASSAAAAALDWKDKAQEWAISGTIVDSLDYSAKWWANQANTWAQAVNPSQFVKLDGTSVMTGNIRVTVPTNGNWAAFLRGPATGMRFVPSASEFAIEAVDETGSGAYRPLRMQGSTVAITGSSIGMSVRPQFGIYTPWDNLNLPNPINDAPSDSSTYARKNAAWVKSVGGAVMSDTAPPSPENGQKWINTLTMREYTWYVDGTSSQWVETTNSDAQRPASDGNDYVMRNGVWVLAPRQLILDGVWTAGAWIELPVPTGFTTFDIDGENIRPGSGTAGYVIAQMSTGGVWRTGSGAYGWGDHYFNSSNHSTWTESTAGSFSTAIAISSGAASSGDSLAHFTAKLWPGGTGNLPVLTYTSKVGISQTDGSGWYGATGAIDRIRFGLSGGVDMQALARVKIWGNR